MPAAGFADVFCTVVETRPPLVVGVAVPVHKYVYGPVPPEGEEVSAMVPPLQMVVVPGPVTVSAGLALAVTFTNLGTLQKPSFTTTLYT